MPIVRTQISINRRGLRLGSQFTCMVGLVFPTMGNSLPSNPMTHLGSHKFPLFPFEVIPLLTGIDPLSFSLCSLLRIANPHSSLTSLIYSLRLVKVSLLRSSLTRVCRVQFNYF